MAVEAVNPEQADRPEVDEDPGIVQEEVEVVEDVAEQNPEAAQVRHFWSWIPSIDDFWDAVQRIKGNFSQGYLTGIERTCIDIWHWIRSWSIWDHLPWDRIRVLEAKITHIYYAIVHKLIEIGNLICILLF